MKQETLELDMDILEPYKIRIRVELINSVEGKEYIKVLNNIFPCVRLSSKIFPLKFCKENSGISKVLCETYKKTLGLLVIYDSSLNDYPFSDIDLCKKYKELKNKTIQYDVEELIILNNTQVDIKKIKEKLEEDFVSYTMIEQNMSISQKVELMEQVVKNIVGRVQDVLRRLINSTFEPTSIPWILKDEVLKPQEVSNKQKGRFEKWKADLCMLSQSTEEAFIFLKNAMNECKAQNDYLWLISINMVRAATILKGKTKLLNTPLENDEAVRLVEQTIIEYDRCGELHLEIETVFKLINTYKDLKYKYAVLEKMRWIEQNLLSKSNKGREIYLRMAEICKELKLDKKAACYAYKCLNYIKDKKYLFKDIMRLMGLCESPEKLIVRNYEEALVSAKMVEERIYMFEYKSIMEPDKLIVATKRLPEGCVLLLREKDLMLKYNFEVQSWSEVQAKLLKQLLNLAQQCEIEIGL